MVKTHTSAAKNHLRFDDLEELHDADGWVHQEHVIEDALVHSSSFDGCVKEGEIRALLETLV